MKAQQQQLQPSRKCKKKEWQTPGLFLFIVVTFFLSITTLPCLGFIPNRNKNYHNKNLHSITTTTAHLVAGFHPQRQRLGFYTQGWATSLFSSSSTAATSRGTSSENATRDAPLVVDNNPVNGNDNNNNNNENDMNELHHQARFGGVDRLYATHANKKKRATTSTATTTDKTAITTGNIATTSSSARERLRAATVVVVGLGGVGSWAAEALCRSGIGHLVLIDLDDICISNTNRQLHTMSSTVGKFKIHVLAERYRDINPACEVTCIDDFVSADNVQDILEHVQNATSSSTITAVLDAIDGSKEKSALLAACTDAQIPTVTCGGAAGRVDPTAICVGDLTRVTNDKLLATCRRDLRKYYNFSAGYAFHERRQARAWKLPAVYSEEQVPDVPGESSRSNLRQCDGALGTACFVTGTFGFVAASQIVSGIAQGTLVPPRR